MSLAQINTLLSQGNTIVSQMPTSEGQVSRIVIGKNMQGLHIPVLTKAPYMGPVNIACGKKELFVVQTGPKSFEIHNSKSAYLRFQK